MKMIEKGWISYMEQIVPKTASPGQVNDTRSAFYAGACILFGAIMTGLSEEDSETSADEDEDFMMSIQAEIEEFAMKLGNG